MARWRGPRSHGEHDGFHPLLFLVNHAFLTAALRLPPLVRLPVFGFVPPRTVTLNAGGSIAILLDGGREADFGIRIPTTLLGGGGVWILARPAPATSIRNSPKLPVP